MRHLIKENRGFTLLEIMLVVIIIAALAAMVAPRLVGKSEIAKRKIAEADVTSNLPTVLELYELENGMFPTTEQGLEALRTQPSTNPIPQNWSGPYLRKKPVDPWGNPYIYVSPGVNNTDYDLSSQGRDVNSTEDDITNWDNG